MLAMHASFFSIGRAVIFCAAGCVPTTALAQAAPWKPSKPVELVLGVAAGGGIDRTARLIQKIVQDRRLVETPLNVVNKPGGGGTIAQTYINAHPGDAHYYTISATSLLTNHIL